MEGTATCCRAFCDADGNPVRPGLNSSREQHRLERRMRLFYRRRYTHHRRSAAQSPVVVRLAHAVASHDSSRASAQKAVAGGDGNQATQPSGEQESGSLEGDGFTRRQRATVDSALLEMLDAVGGADHLYVDLRCARATGEFQADRIS